MLVIKKVKPLYNSIITTMDVYTDDITVNGIIDTTKQAGSLKEYQKVLAVGSFVKDIKVGDIVCINPTRYAIKKHEPGSLKDGVITDNPVIKYNFNTINIDGKDCLFLQDRDIDFIVEEFVEEEHKIIPVKPNIITD
jgi:co-chaperonin GroES (HSP10)